MKKFNEIHNRLIDISYAHNLSHLSSCITTLPILYCIYKDKNPSDIVILSNGHAGLAQYVCLEAFEDKNAEDLYERHGVHPARNLEDNIFCSTGSLGLGLPVAIGAAMGNKDIDVYCVISDGECCEGSIWESLYFLSKHPLSNLYIFVNVNGFSAYDTINIDKLTKYLNAFELANVSVIDTSEHLKKFKWLDEKGIEAHYCKIIDEDSSNRLKYLVEVLN